MITILTMYFVGYFISFGLCLGFFDKKGFDAYTAAFVISFLSWINIGLFMADLLPNQEKIK